MLQRIYAHRRTVREHISCCSRMNCSTYLPQNLHGLPHFPRSGGTSSKNTSLSDLPRQLRLYSRISRRAPRCRSRSRPMRFRAPCWISPEHAWPPQTDTADSGEKKLEVRACALRFLPVPQLWNIFHSNAKGQIRQAKVSFLYIRIGDEYALFTCEIGIFRSLLLTVSNQ